MTQLTHVAHKHAEMPPLAHVGIIMKDYVVTKGTVCVTVMVLEHVTGAVVQKKQPSAMMEYVYARAQTASRGSCRKRVHRQSQFFQILAKVSQ